MTLPARNRAVDAKETEFCPLAQMGGYLWMNVESRAKNRVVLLSDNGIRCPAIKG